jgi:SAM-dependent methyltransferase
MSAHTHDGIDWVTRLADLRQADEANGPAYRGVADRLIESLPAPCPTVMDVGSGAGGMSAALAEALAGRAARSGGAQDAGMIVLVDAVPELLDAAAGLVRSVPGVGVRAALVDLAVGTDESFAADLVWASNVAHHVPDQRAVVTTLAGWLAPGGCLALAEGGLSMRCLPWDIGIGEPGLQDRILAAQGTWFASMRTEMPGSVRLPVGWNVVLAEAGLSDVTAFTYLVDVPAPLSDGGRAAVRGWLAWLSTATDLLDPADQAVVARLLDPADAAYVGRREDVFLLKASTVHLGWHK